MKLKILMVGFILLVMISCGDTIVHEHKHIHEQKTETIKEVAEPLKLLSIDELNAKLATIADETEFDAQVFFSVEKFEKTDNFLVRVLPERVFQIVSWKLLEPLLLLPISLDEREIGCEQEDGTACRYEPVRPDFFDRVSLFLRRE